MQRRFFYVLTALAMLTLPAAAHAQQRPAGDEALTNASVIKLVRGGFSDKAVIAIINSRPTRFDLAPERLIELKKGGVSEKVILAMLGRMPSETFSDDWGGDDDDAAFFGDFGGAGGGREAGPLPGGSDPGGINIFGSSGGARGRTRSRGVNGGLENDTQTVGSATVRILRPPAEAGRAPAKLERTPSLTNESVIQLVEGGFTEGTIIRRIEQSPVEFDLSDKSLSELRRRRVTEPIIAAMRAAMGEEEAATTPED